MFPFAACIPFKILIEKGACVSYRKNLKTEVCLRSLFFILLKLHLVSWLSKYVGVAELVWEQDEEGLSSALVHGPFREYSTTKGQVSLSPLSSSTDL